MSNRWPGGSFGLVLALHGSGSDGNREEEDDEEEAEESIFASFRLSFDLELRLGLQI
jgi:hypothetical protein